jgi:hypothetical protein
VLFHIFQKVLGLGIAIGGTLTATLLAVIGWLLTHQNPAAATFARARSSICRSRSIAMT